jgi:adenine-specific DNA-methyltransferase
MPTPLEKFQTLLRELFQFEQADLDFGVYRIMNLRRERMERWLNEELPARARAILAQGGATADDDLSSRLEAVKTEILSSDPGAIDEDGNLVNQAWEQIPKGKEYLKLKEQADRAPARTAAGMEPLVYNHLYDFFSRYYDTGDFIPKRRRSFAPDGRDTYAIPWDGEEVVLHWANKDQYYIKTGERFTHYRWQSNVGGHTFTIEFRLTDAELPANNNKDAKKKFNLLVADKVEWQEDKATLVLPFHYRGLTPEEEGQYTGTQEAKLRESIIKRTVDTLRASPAVGGVQHLGLALMAPKRDAAGQEKRDKDGNAVPLLPHHLNRWAVKNESDFFIHKDLRRFLSGELGYFLKSVVLNLDNLLAAGEQRAEPNFRLLAAVKRLGTEIVDFVSQLENFQKALFEKKKFVLETSWCLTLDRIPASVKEEVYAAILANDRQWEEWETLYKISQWPADLATVAPRTRGFLEAYPYLMLDSGLKDREGKLAYEHSLQSRLLDAFDDLDGETNGLILHSDNLQALNFLRPAYRNRIDAVYIDPPYNTDASPIIYKNGYRRSSWSALLANRLELDALLRVHPSVRCIAIDDFEYPNLQGLLEGSAEVHHATAAVRSKPQGRPTASGFSANHEYAVFWGDADAKIGRLPRTGSKAQRYPLSDAEGVYAWANFRKSGTDSNRSDRPRSFYPVYVPGTNIRIPNLNWNDAEEKWDIGDELRQGEVAVLPIDSDGTEKVWTCSPDTARDELEDMRVDVGANSRIEISKKYRPNQEGALPGTWWSDPSYSASESGTKLLKNLFGAKDFDFPKSINLVVDCLRVCNVTRESTVLDYFGGSGTTGHAVINLNREDGGVRKYVVVEVGDYFDSILKPRLQKVVFADEWKAGVPKRQAGPVEPNNSYGGVSHCIKVLRLESYEDALDNIEFNSGAAPGSELGLDFRRDYELRYALDWESKDCPTRLAVAQLDTPFDYTLTLRRESGTVNVKPDLPETFAYLIGLHTRRRFRTERAGVSYLIYTGALHADGTEVAVLWRTCTDWTAANLKAEMDWWRAQRETLAPGATRVYVNGASAIDGHHSLDAEFKTRMHGGSG